MGGDFFGEEKKESEESDSKKEAYYGVGKFVLEIVKVVALAFFIIVPVRVFIFQPFFVQGASMEPNFHDREYLIINEVGYKRTEVGFSGRTLFTVEPFREIERQTPIVFRYPLDPRKFFIKRVIGLPGEKVEVKDNRVTIFNDSNPEGFVLDESVYLPKSTKTSGDLVITLSQEEYFVMGDNRSFSSDSRSWGPVEKGDIMGKVLLRAWPLDKAKIF